MTQTPSQKITKPSGATYDLDRELRDQSGSGGSAYDPSANGRVPAVGWLTGHPQRKHPRCGRCTKVAYRLKFTLDAGKRDWEQFVRDGDFPVPQFDGTPLRKDEYAYAYLDRMMLKGMMLTFPNQPGEGALREPPPPEVQEYLSDAIEDILVHQRKITICSRYEEVYGRPAPDDCEDTPEPPEGWSFEDITPENLLANATLATLGFAEGAQALIPNLISLGDELQGQGNPGMLFNRSWDGDPYVHWTFSSPKRRQAYLDELWTFTTHMQGLESGYCYWKSSVDPSPGGFTDQLTWYLWPLRTDGNAPAGGGTQTYSGSGWLGLDGNTANIEIPPTAEWLLGLMAMRTAIPTGFRVLHRGVRGRLRGPFRCR